MQQGQRLGITQGLFLYNHLLQPSGTNSADALMQQLLTEILLRREGALTYLKKIKTIILLLRVRLGAASLMSERLRVRQQLAEW